MKKAFLRFSICMFIILFFSLSTIINCSASNTTKESSKQKLTLHNLITLALKNSPELSAIAAGVRGAKYDVKEAKAGFLPQMDVDAAVGPVNDAEKPIVKTDLNTGIGEIVSPTPTDEYNGVNIFGRLDLTISQPIFTFGKIMNRYKASKEGYEAAKYELDKKKGEIILKVKELYYALILSGMGEKTANESEDFFADIQKKVEKLLKVGATNVTSTDVYRIEAYRAATKQFKSKARKGARVTYRALKSLIGYPEGKDFLLDVKELPFQKPALNNQQFYVKEALNKRPEFAQLKRGMAAKKYMVAAAKADLFPSFFFVVKGAFADAPGRDEWDDPYINDDFHRSDLGFFLGGNWHFDLGIGQAKLSRKRAEYESMVNKLTAAKRGITLQVIKYYEDTLEALHAVQAYEKASLAARRWIVAAISNFDMGIGGVRDVLDAIEKYSKNRGEYLSALYDYNTDLARLSFAVAEYRQNMKEGKN